MAREGDPRPDKVAVVDEVKGKLSASSAALLTEYRGNKPCSVIDSHVIEQPSHVELDRTDTDAKSRCDGRIRIAINNSFEDVTLARREIPPRLCSSHRRCERTWIVPSARNCEPASASPAITDRHQLE